MTASDLVRQEVGEPRTCLPEDYERGDAAGKERQERTADGWHLSDMEELRKQKG